MEVYSHFYVFILSFVGRGNATGRFASPRSPTRCLHKGQFVRALTIKVGTAVAQWLRRCATSRKVAGSITDGFIEIFH